MFCPVWPMSRCALSIFPPAPLPPSPNGGSWLSPKSRVERSRCSCSWRSAGTIAGPVFGLRPFGPGWSRFERFLPAISACLALVRIRSAPRPSWLCSRYRGLAACHPVFVLAVGPAPSVGARRGAFPLAGFPGSVCFCFFAASPGILSSLSTTWPYAAPRMPVRLSAEKGKLSRQREPLTAWNTVFNGSKREG